MLPERQMRKPLDMLLNQGADAFVQDIDGKSALDYARGNHRIKTIFAKALNVEVEALFPR